VPALGDPSGPLRAAPAVDPYRAAAHWDGVREDPQDPHQAKAVLARPGMFLPIPI